MVASAVRLVACTFNQGTSHESVFECSVAVVLTCSLLSAPGLLWSSAMLVRRLVDMLPSP